MKVFAPLIAFLGVATAFVQPSAFRGTSISRAQIPKATTRAAAPVMLETYWDGDAPPSSVLGPALEKANSKALGILSLAAFAVGTYCIHETNIFHTVNPDALNAPYIAGSVLVPISWGLHVASWINSKNGN
ncbi:unnamed protein product [Discosporangium mesarthrocarpum]